MRLGEAQKSFRNSIEDQRVRLAAVQERIRDPG